MGRPSRRVPGWCAFAPDETDEKGHLVRKPGGSWAFRYDITGDDGRGRLSLQ